MINVMGFMDAYKVSMLVHYGWRYEYHGWVHPEGKTIKKAALFDTVKECKYWDTDEAYWEVLDMEEKNNDKKT
jgi:hypothetical protein